MFRITVWTNKEVELLKELGFKRIFYTYVKKEKRIKGYCMSLTTTEQKIDQVQQAIKFLKLQYTIQRQGE